MDKKIFISEFNLSYQHGGGLTCNRVLSDSLWSFDKYYSLHFTEKDFPIMEPVRDRTVALAEQFPYPHFESGFNFKNLLFKSQQAIHRLSGLHLNDFQDYSIFSNKVCRHFLQDHSLESANILVIPQGNLSIDIINALYNAYKTPYITWMMDDHLLRYNQGKWHYPRGYENKLEMHLKNAYKVLTISQSMSDFYRERFGVSSEVLFGGADFYNEEQSNPLPKDKLYLGYFGSLHSWQVDAITSMIPYLSTLNVEIHLYAHQPLPDFLHHERILHKGSLNPNEIGNVMRKYHGILLPNSFESQYRHMVQLNIATKMSEAISSGTVPVVIGPEYSAMAKFITSRELGLCINSSKNMIKISELTDAALRQKWIANCQKCYLEEISTPVMQHRWQSIWKDFINT